MGQKKQQARKIQSTGRKANRIPLDWRKLSLPYFILLGVYGIGSFFPDARVWGINPLAFLPEWFRFTWFGIGVLFLTPAFFGMVHHISKPLQGKRDGAPSVVFVALFVSMIGVLFWLLRMNTYFLGDGAVYLAEHFRYIRGLPISEDVLFSRLSAPLSAWMLAEFAHVAITIPFMKALVVENAQFTWWVLGVMSGAMFLIIIWRAATWFGKTGLERLTIIVLFLFLPGTIFFFGYVEYYTFLYVLLALYFLLAVRAAKGSIGPIGPGIILLVSIGFHFMAILAVPSFFVLLLLRSSKGNIRQIVTTRHLAYALCGLLLLSGVYYFASGIYERGSRIVLSLVPFGKEGSLHSYTLLSSMHLVDLLNIFLMVCGIPCLALVALFRKSSLNNPSILLALTNVAMFAFLTIFGFMGFGMARDWDINAPFGLACATLLVVTIYLSEDSHRKQFLLYLVSASMIVFGSVWLAVNLDESASVTRYRSIVQLDDKHISGDYALNGYEHLRKYYFSKADHVNVAWAIQKKIECVGYAEDYRKLVRTVVEKIPVQEQKRYFDWIFQRLETTLRTMKVQGEETSYAGSREAFFELAAESLLQFHFLSANGSVSSSLVDGQVGTFESIETQHPILEMVQAQIRWDGTNQPQDEKFFIRGGDAIQSSSLLALYAGRALVNLRQYPKAIPVLEKSFALDPTFSLPLVYLAIAEFNTASYLQGKAADHLKAFLNDPAGHRLSGNQQTEQYLVNYARGLLDQIQTSSRLSAQTQ